MVGIEWCSNCGGKVEIVEMMSAVNDNLRLHLHVEYSPSWNAGTEKLEGRERIDVDKVYIICYLLSIIVWAV